MADTSLGLSLCRISVPTGGALHTVKVNLNACRAAEPRAPPERSPAAEMRDRNSSSGWIVGNPEVTS